MKRFLFLLLMTAHAAAGQTGDSTVTSPFPPVSNFKRGFIAEIGFSHTLTSLPNIRSFFRSNQVQSGGSLDLFVNIGFGLRFNRLKVLSQLGYSLQSPRSYTELPATGSQLIAQKTAATYAALLVGYDLVNARNRRLYINAGFSSLEYGFTIFRRTGQTVSFPNVLQTGQPAVVPSLTLTNVGCVDVNLEYTQREKRKRNVESIIRVGYRMGTYAKAYESDAYRLIDAPKDRIGQFYLQTNFSFSVNSDRFQLR